MPPGAKPWGGTSMELFGVWRHLQGPPRWQESTGRTDHEDPGSSGPPKGGVRFEGYAAEVLPPLSPGEGRARLEAIRILTGNGLVPKRSPRRRG